MDRLDNVALTNRDLFGAIANDHGTDITAV